MIVRLLAHVFMAKAQASRARHENHELRRRVSFLENQISRIRDERDEARGRAEKHLEARVAIENRWLKLIADIGALQRDNIRLQSERDHERDVNRRARARANITSTPQPAPDAAAAPIPVWSYGSPHTP